MPATRILAVAGRPLIFLLALLWNCSLVEAITSDQLDTQSFVNSTSVNPLRRTSVVTDTCLTMSTGSPVDMFLWTEYETVDARFFNNLFTFMQGNCGLGRLTRLIMRMSTPTSMWLPTTASPFFAFLKKLNSYGYVIEMIFFPYLMDVYSRKQWIGYGGAANPIDNTIIFMQKWNKLLVNAGFANKFKGIVFDYEERKNGWALAPAIDIDQATVKRLKNTFGAFELGITIGWDDYSKFAAYPWVDRFYMQMYDLYDSKGAFGATARSPFLIYRNDPQALVNYFMGTLFSANMMSAYKANVAKISAMWSWQTPANTCLFPKGTSCGLNYEFGKWSAPAFNLFLKKLMYASPVFAAIKHGVFFFGLEPLSWLR